MYYRRKILLALIEAFGGTLSNTDCQKLLFLFCARRGKDYYDFFPHKYGSFSFTLSQDKERLVDSGFLAADYNFQLKGNQSFLGQVEEKDRAALRALVFEVDNLRGEELVRKISLEFPHYASKSQFATKIWGLSQYEEVRHGWDNTETACLFTIGYEGLTIDAYLGLLHSNNVAVLVDVRKNALSRKNGFSKKKLAECAKVAGIEYIHIPDLGIPSNLRQRLNSKDAYRNLFDYYSSYILPEHKIAIERLKTIVCDQRRVAITCFEADHQFCHRSKIAELLEDDPEFKTPIVHISKKYSHSFY